MRPTMNRRGFLSGITALGIGAAVAGCSGGSSGTSSGGLQWWDHFSAYQDLQKEWAKGQSEQLGVPVTYTYYEASKAGESLRLANQAKKLPDVFSNVVGLPLAALVADKWIREVELSDDTLKRLPKEILVEGVTKIDGKLYGVPLQSFRSHPSFTWTNVELFAKAGLDPADIPGDYDSFRATCQKLKAAGVAPMTIALGADGGRAGDQINDMAQVAGFPGLGGVRYATGEYGFHDDTYVNAIEFWKELFTGGLMLSGTNTFSVVNARTRYASGGVAIFIDGAWSPGGSRVLQPDFLPKMGVGQVVTPEAGAPVALYRNLSGPTFVISGSTKDPEAASKLVESFTGEDYLVKITEAMDAPPIDLDLVATADVTDPYKKAVTMLKEQVFQGPQAVVRNPDVSLAEARRKPVTPGLGAIVQGYLGGDVPDLRAALKTLSDANETEREKAIAAAKADGAEVALDDYAFPDWKPGADYAYSK
ncbi:ABC transporter substrate-binding protein [Microlunatus parietis]|uniref:Multiple sugar transport system substrate-binding protein n=1 Tax=Microlunatus parietis TaxID=682979 RepID=A0A7Y9I9E7_9ACTN|nr:ABC transporter substrate-binding protein [Microlunatus parietis]NYE72695.1 multiple sugar transport system substrate-binding protein [Microlunatus parietis]